MLNDNQPADSGADRKQKSRECAVRHAKVAFH